MNRSTASALAVALAAMAGTSLADDITIDPLPFKSSLTRDEVLLQLKARPSQYSTLQIKAPRSSQEVRAEYLANRHETAALTSEDSGSAYFSRTATGGAPTATMGGPAR